LIRDFFTARGIVIRNAKQFHAFYVAQIGDVGFAMMMGKGKNADLYH